MTKISLASGMRLVSRLKTCFKTRAFIIHDGRGLQRFSLGARAQAAIAGVAGVTMCFSACGVAQAATGAAALGGSVDAPLRQVEARQAATGGPFEAVDSAAAAADLRADTQFRTLFMTWKKLDGLEQGVIAVPSAQPVEHLAFTSNFGIRTDPFRGTAAMHTGVDIPGPVGTPVYATADGIVDRAERAGGYGNLVELDHGKGIQTRYGHLSRILVEPGAHVQRGQLIALMGSTGRSTGPHLHYEVRLDGHAVNPAPFLQTADFVLAAQDKTLHIIPVTVAAATGSAAMGGPAAD